MNEFKGLKRDIKQIYSTKISGIRKPVLICEEGNHSRVVATFLSEEEESIFWRYVDEVILGNEREEE